MNEFQNRLKEAFNNANMAQIAKRLGVPHATVRNYFKGRLPATEVLIKIARETGVSLNWLLMGTGEMYVSGQQSPDLGKIFERKVEEIIDRKLSRRYGVQDLGMVDSLPAFDVAGALAAYDDPHRVMLEWFTYEGREYPQDYSVIFFEGWGSYTDDEKLDAVRDAKKVLDRILKKTA